jgi:hypothetical protein
MDNRFEHNDAWGNIFVPYPDSGPPCTGGTDTPQACIYDEYGDAMIGNRYKDNGSYGNPTNGDFAVTNLETDPTDCFRGAKEIGGGTVTSSPPNAEQTYPTCTGKSVPPDTNAQFLDQVACDSDSISLAGLAGSTICPPGAHYPRQTKVVMHKLPGAKKGPHGRSALENPASAHLKTMPNPCSGVPRNPWCPHNPTSYHPPKGPSTPFSPKPVSPYVATAARSEGARLVAWRSGRLS